MSPTRKILFTLIGVMVTAALLYRLQLPSPEERSAKSGGETTEAGALPKLRLPDTVTPLAYRLRFAIDPQAARFSGQTEIDVELAAPTRHIVLNGKNFSVRQARVFTSGGEAVAAAYREIAGTGLAELRLRRLVDTKLATIVIDYEAPFGALEGVYKVVSGDQPYVFTQFEATSARTAFPGFDEPRFKTPYHMSFRVPVGQTVVGNTQVAVERRLGDGHKIVALAPTAALPTYLIAFAIGPLEIIDGKTMAANQHRTATIPLRAVTPSGKGEAARPALARTEDILTAIEAYTGIGYSYGKLDLIAAPDFAASAMENPGAIVYRDSLLLLGAAPPQERLRRFDSIHAHELAHQWFGNLVTSAWWEDIWLNESFADWMAAKMLSRLRPAQGFDQDINRGARTAMALDAGSHVRAVRQPIRTQEDIDAAFTPITYEKGAAILTMFESYMGADKFRAAVKLYLQKHAGGIATTEDFLKAINETTGEEGTAAALKSFIDQPGVPLATVSWGCPQTGVTLNVSQSRYRPIGVPAVAETLWSIPMCVRMLSSDGTDSTECIMATRQHQTFYLREAKCPAVIVPNANGRGYYRWRLSAEDWQYLGDRAARLRPAEALSFADNLSAAFRDGALAFGDYLPLIQQLAASSDGAAATVPIADLKFLLHDVVPRDAQAQAAARALIADIYRPRLEVGLENLDAQPTDDSYETREPLRRLLSLYTLDLQDSAISALMAARGKAYVGYGQSAADASAVAGDFRRIAFSAALMAEGSPFAEHLLKTGQLQDDPAFREDAVLAMAATPHAEVIGRLLDYLLSPPARGDEMHRSFAVLAGNPAAASLVWPWLLDHLDAILARLPEWRKGEVVMAAAGFCQAEDAVLVRQALQNRLAAIGAEQRLAETVAAISRCAALKAAVSAQVLQAFGLAAGAPAPEVR